MSAFSPGRVVYTSKFLLTFIPTGFPLLKLSIQEYAFFLSSSSFSV